VRGLLRAREIAVVEDRRRELVGGVPVSRLMHDLLNVSVTPLSLAPSQTMMACSISIETVTSSSGGRRPRTTARPSVFAMPAFKKLDDPSRWRR